MVQHFIPLLHQNLSLPTLYGRPPHTTIEMFHTLWTSTTSTKLLQEHTLVVYQLKQNLHRNRQRIWAQADNHPTNRSFNIGDWVWLRLQPYQEHSVEYRLSPKVSPCYFGPYRIEHRTGTMWPTSSGFPRHHESIQCFTSCYSACLNGYPQRTYLTQLHPTHHFWTYQLLKTLIHQTHWHHRTSPPIRKRHMVKHLRGVMMQTWKIEHFLIKPNLSKWWPGAWHMI